ncbi:MAG: phage portal protein [Deltaproteobacteria bacterium]|nr:phage portal protein [Deltaproteobacteria bacterium]
MPSTIEQWLRLNAVAGGSERYYHLNELEAWYWGLQYSNLAHGWDDVSYPLGHALAGQPIPTRKKRPSVRYPLARRMVTEAADLLVGEGRFPLLTVDGAPDATEALRTLLKKARATRRAHPLARMGISVGSVACALHFEAGRPTLILYPAKHCEPVFGDDDPAAAAQWGIESDDLVSLRVQYLFVEEQLRAGSWRRIWYGFRRDYTPNAIVDYDRPEIGEDGADMQRIPTFREVRRVEHNYGFVPVEWFRTEEIEDTSDGSGLYESILDILADIDYALSRLAGAVEYNTDPLMVIRGIPHEEMRHVQALLMTGKGNTLSLGGGRMQGDSRDATYLEITGSSLEAATKHIQEQRSRALECAQVVIQRHEEGVGAQSGVSLRMLYRPMLSLIHGYREQFGSSFERLASKLLRAADRRRGELSFVLPTYSAGDVTAVWPPVFELAGEELQAHALTMAQLVGSRVLSHETAVERTAALLSVEDVEQEKKRIASEQADLVEAVPSEDDGGEV